MSYFISRSPSRIGVCTHLVFLFFEFLVFARFLSFFLFFFVVVVQSARAAPDFLDRSNEELFDEEDTPYRSSTPGSPYTSSLGFQTSRSMFMHDSPPQQTVQEGIDYLIFSSVCWISSPHSSFSLSLFSCTSWERRRSGWHRNIQEDISSSKKSLTSTSPEFRSRCNFSYCSGFLHFFLFLLYPSLSFTIHSRISSVFQIFRFPIRFMVDVICE